MERTIISHDVDTAKIRVKFEHNGVTLEDDYDLKKVVPSSQYVFEQMGLPFDETVQLKALDTLTQVIQAQIEEGVIVNAPVEKPVVYEAPEPSPEPTPKATKKK